MNTAAEITLEWGDGEYLFSLKMKQLEELERVCDAPFGAIMSRLMSGEFKVSDVFHTIRLGLIGGGMSPVEAKRKVDMYVDGQPFAKAGDPSSPYATALVILSAAFYGLDEIEHPTGDGDKSGKLTPATAGSGSASTELHS